MRIIALEVIALIKNSNKKNKYKKIRQLNSIFILSFLLPQSSSIIIFDCVNNKSFKI